MATVKKFVYKLVEDPIEGIEYYGRIINELPLTKDNVVIGKYNNDKIDDTYVKDIFTYKKTDLEEVDKTELKPSEDYHLFKRNKESNEYEYLEGGYYNKDSKKIRYTIVENSDDFKVYKEVTPTAGGTKRKSSRRKSHKKKTRRNRRKSVRRNRRR
jgi:hypothetical protein